MSSKFLEWSTYIHTELRIVLYYDTIHRWTWNSVITTVILGKLYSMCHLGMSMYRAEWVLVCNVDAFRYWTKGERAIIDKLRRIAPPFGSSFVEVQESKEYKRPCKSNSCIQCSWQYVVILLPPPLMVLENAEVEYKASKKPWAVGDCNCRWPLVRRSE